ncbi:MAG: DUF2335 domain-containing protein [bacterium]|nr:DUF2335 domain-containing protein [bacterium]
MDDPDPAKSDRKQEILEPSTPPTAPETEVSIEAIRWHRGPLPPPAQLAEYNEVLPGLAERIVTLTEEEARHRRSLEQKALEATSRNSENRDVEAKRGQVFAFTIAMSFILAGLIVAIWAEPWAGTVFGGIGIGGIVSTFVLGRREQATTREKSDEPRTVEETASPNQPTPDQQG